MYILYLKIIQLLPKFFWYDSTLRLLAGNGDKDLAATCFFSSISTLWHPDGVSGVADMAAHWYIRSDDTVPSDPHHVTWCYLNYLTWCYPLTPQRQPVTRCRPNCYLIYQVWPYPLGPSRWRGAGLAATWSILSGDTLWPPAGEGVQAWLLPDLSCLLTPSDPQQARGCRPGCYLIYPVWWHPLTPRRRGGAGLAAGITEAGLVGGARSGAHHSTPAHRYRHNHVSCPPITTLRYLYITEKMLHVMTHYLWQQIFQGLWRLKIKSENKIISFANWDHSILSIHVYMFLNYP